MPRIGVVRSVAWLFLVGASFAWGTGCGSSSDTTETSAATSGQDGGRDAERQPTVDAASSETNTAAGYGEGGGSAVDGSGDVDADHGDVTRTVPLEAGAREGGASDSPRSSDAGRGVPDAATATAPDASDAETAASPRPCDVYASGGTPCVAAHSTVRALYAGYAGSLYQVRRASDGTTRDIVVFAPGGTADAAAQDAFCAGTTCVVSIIYDQSPKHNHLATAPAGGAVRTADRGVTANRLPLTAASHAVYGAYFEGGMGYRKDDTSGIATGDDPESLYMVTSGTHYNNQCCFDYGNAETNNDDDGAGTMEAVYFGNSSFWGKGAGSGPWVMADLENGLYAGPSFAANPRGTPLTSPYVTAMVKGTAGRFTLKGGNAQSGGLATLYDGARPKGYDPMKKQGAIILGIGGDNSDWAVGSFFEGCITTGYASDATDDAVQASIVAAGYGR